MEYTEDALKNECECSLPSPPPRSVNVVTTIDVWFDQSSISMLTSAIFSFAASARLS